MAVKRKIIGITGNPATGKKTIGKLVSKSLGYRFIDLNHFAIKEGCIVNDDGTGLIVDTNLLREKIVNGINEKDYVIVGHLLPDVIPRRVVDLVFVLRRSPDHLVRRYAKRGYTDEKIRENVMSEAIGIVFSNALNVYGKRKTAEIDTSRKSPSEILSVILEVLKNPQSKEFGMIDWLPIMVENEYLRKFLV